MTEIASVLAQISDNAERNRDVEPAANVRPQRRAGAGNPAILSVRLTTEQYQLLSARAERAGRPTSAEARDIILVALGESDEDRLGAKLEEVLRRTIAPDMLAERPANGDSKEKVTNRPTIHQHAERPGSRTPLNDLSDDEILGYDENGLPR